MAVKKPIENTIFITKISENKQHQPTFVPPFHLTHMMLTQDFSRSSQVNKMDHCEVIMMSIVAPV